VTARGRTLALLAIALAASLSAPGSAAAMHRCQSTGSDTVEASRYARIFSKPRVRRPAYRVTAYYGCLYSAGKKFHLGDVGEPGLFISSFSPLRLAGRFAAYGISYEGPAGGFYAVVRVRDLRNGSVFEHEAFSAGSNDDGTKQVSDLELSRDGSVAWIARVNAQSPPPTEVHIGSRTGARLADVGFAIEPLSLALSGSRIYWYNGATARSDTFLGG